ncbi:MAG: DMT family transporter [Chloroflexota bacterium]|jgi:drug/metabolite transporter (DMT)-like permease
MPTYSQRVIAGIALAIGIIVIASASILIRLAQAGDVPSLVIAAVRLGISATVLSVIVAVTHQSFPHGVTRKQAGLAVIAGTCLALHFATWIQSLEYTSVASSAALVTTNPLWVGIVAWLLFGEKLNRWRVMGMFMTIVGSLAIAFSDSQTQQGSNPLLGNALAIIGAMSGSAYFLVGRGLRNQLPLLHYVWMTYGSAAIVLLIAALSTGDTRMDYPVEIWLVLLGLAVGPQLIGHTTINFAMRHFSALLVTIAILGEPVGSAILAFILFDEAVAAIQLVGFVSLLIGITITAIGETKQHHEPQST